MSSWLGGLALSFCRVGRNSVAKQSTKIIFHFILIFIFSARRSKFDASNFAVADLLAATATNVMATSTNATTLGLKWILNPHTRLLLNYVKTDFKNAAGTALVNGSASEKAVIFRGQVDF